MKTLGIVTARSGSKGLPGKNTRLFCGKPLINWTIEAGIQSKLEDIIVSTDCKNIADIALNAGAQVPFLRPKSLAQDNSTSVDVIIHAINEMRIRGKQYDLVSLLEPTSPLRDAKDIDNAVEVLCSAHYSDSIVSITEAECSHPSFLYSYSNQRLLTPYTGKHPTNIRRQDIEKLYYLEGSIYISKVSNFLEKKSFYHETTIGYLMPKEKSIEIDDLYDFIMAEALFQHSLQDS